MAEKYAGSYAAEKMTGLKMLTMDRTCERRAPDPNPRQDIGHHVPKGRTSPLGPQLMRSAFVPAFSDISFLDLDTGEFRGGNATSQEALHFGPQINAIETCETLPLALPPPTRHSTSSSTFLTLPSHLPSPLLPSLPSLICLALSPLPSHVSSALTSPPFPSLTPQLRDDRAQVWQPGVRKPF